MPGRCGVVQPALMPEQAAAFLTVQQAGCVRSGRGHPVQKAVLWQVGSCAAGGSAARQQ